MTESPGFEHYLNVRTAYGASFSPDGQRICFLTDITGVAEVWSVPVDLSATTPAWPEQLTFRAAPLFVVHGANDPRVPLGEAEQIVAAVRARGLPVEYLVFPDEGHGLVRRANRLVAYPAIARFLDEHLLSRAAR